MVTITKLKFLKKKQLCQVELDNDEMLFLSLDLFIKFKLNINKSLDEATLVKIKKEQRLIDAKRSSLNYISYKPKNKPEISCFCLVLILTRLNPA